MQTIGDRVEHRGRDAGDQVRRAGAGGRERHADLARGARVAVGHVRRALLVPHEHVADRVLQQRVVDGHHRAAGVAEDDVDPFAREHLPDDLRAGATPVAHSPSATGAGRDRRRSRRARATTRARHVTAEPLEIRVRALVRVARRVLIDRDARVVASSR